jgi:hypothetical protein
MIIANPIYDTVFKYLLEDIEISKGLLSAIIDETIIHLSVQPQETIYKTTANSLPLTIYRLDFKAIVEMKNGEQKKILIELQKTKRSADIMRFRRYLADNYQNEDSIIVGNEQILQPLEIVTIYFLGFKLENIETPILKVSNCFYDVSKQKMLELKPREPFIDLLNHESYTIQIPRLPDVHQTDLENMLSVFNQNLVTVDRHELNYVNENLNPLAKKIVDRLNRAVADKELMMGLNIEDEIERTYGREMNELNDQLVEKDNEIEKLKKEIEKLKRGQ